MPYCKWHNNDIMTTDSTNQLAEHMALYAKQGIETTGIPCRKVYRLYHLVPTHKLSDGDWYELQKLSRQKGQ